MTDYSYAVTPLRLSGNSALTEASKEELRVLLLLIELGGRVECVGDMAKAAAISEARCKSALAFWEESGVITARDGDNPAIINEFEEKLRPGEIDEVESVKVAESIRKEGLALMLEECAKQLGQACLSNAEVKSLTALHTQYGLAPEFVAILASYLSKKGALKVRRLCNEAIRLSGKKIDTVEALERYIDEKETTSGIEWEFRRLLGIHGRNLTPSEKGYFKKWSEEYEYSVSIVEEAFDIAVMNTKDSKGDLRYMDSVLTDWHNAGCKTVSECKARSAARHYTDKSAEPKKRQKTDAPTPRYGNFDVNDAFKKALERSYGENED